MIRAICFISSVAAVTNSTVPIIKVQPWEIKEKEFSDLDSDTLMTIRNVFVRFKGFYEGMYKGFYRNEDNLDDI